MRGKAETSLNSDVSRWPQEEGEGEGEERMVSPHPRAGNDPSFTAEEEGLESFEARFSRIRSIDSCTGVYIYSRG